VRVQDAAITLMGEVDRGYQKVAAESAVRHLKGVVWSATKLQSNNGGTSRYPG